MEIKRRWVVDDVCTNGGQRRRPDNRLSTRAAHVHGPSRASRSMQCPWSFLTEDQDLTVELPEQIKTERPSPARSPASKRTEARSIAGESRCPHPEHEARMTA